MVRGVTCDATFGKCALLTSADENRGEGGSLERVEQIKMTAEFWLR